MSNNLAAKLCYRFRWL